MERVEEKTNDIKQNYTNNQNNKDNKDNNKYDDAGNFNGKEVEQIEGRVEEIKEELKQSISKLGERGGELKEAVNNLTSHTGDFVKQSKDTAVCYGKNIAKKTDSTTKRGREFIRKHPKESIALAIAVVGLVSAILNRRKISTLNHKMRQVDLKKIKKAGSNALYVIEKEAGKLKR